MWFRKEVEYLTMFLNWPFTSMYIISWRDNKLEIEKEILVFGTLISFVAL